MKFILIAVPEYLWYQHRHNIRTEVRWYDYSQRGVHRYKVCAVKFDDYRMKCGGLDAERLARMVGNLADLSIIMQACDNPAALARTMGLLPEEVEVKVD